MEFDLALGDVTVLVGLDVLDAHCLFAVTVYNRLVNVRERNGTGVPSYG